MKIWHLKFKLDDYAGLYPEDDGFDIMENFSGKPMKEWWTPLQMFSEEPNGRRNRKAEFGDAPGGLFPVFSKKAVDVLGPLIGEDAEILELEYPGYEFYAINVTTVLDVVDYEKSKCRYSRDGKKILHFDRYAFRDCEEIREHHIFKIVDEVKRWEFVSDDFKKAAEDNGLEGFRFVLLWDSEDTDPDSKVKYGSGLD